MRLKRLFASCAAAAWTALFAATTTAAAEPEFMHTERIRFEANALDLSGIVDTPVNQTARAAVIFIHGYGATNVVAENWYFDLRTRFAQQGITSMVWDKPGCGESDGKFDADQSIEDSAREVIAGAAFLRENNIPGADKIGLWGVSRAGWIAPIALAEDPNLAFWISVSGVDGHESFGYLLKSNWELKGYTEGKIKHLLDQWRAGLRITASGGSFDEYRAATKDYHQDPFVNDLTGPPNKENYHKWREKWQETPPQFDEDTGLLVYIPNFDDLLASLDVPVLALFGEKDRNVDWQKTKRLYEETIGQNPDDLLTIKTFADGNHNLHQSETGGFEEMIEILNAPAMVSGYYETIEAWVDALP